MMDNQEERKYYHFNPKTKKVFSTPEEITPEEAEEQNFIRYNKVSVEEARKSDLTRNLKFYQLSIGLVICGGLALFFLLKKSDKQLAFEAAFWQSFDSYCGSLVTETMMTNLNKDLKSVEIAQLMEDRKQLNDDLTKLLLETGERAFGSQSKTEKVILDKMKYVYEGLDFKEQLNSCHEFNTYSEQLVEKAGGIEKVRRILKEQGL